VISWWCTALGRPWKWEWIPYPGIWIAIILPVGLYLWSVHRHEGEVDRRRLSQFLGGMLVFWASTDWPLGTLGAGYLASAHMAQFLLYTLGAAPLVMLGIPEWMARNVARRFHFESVVVRLGRSVVVCGVLYNLILLATHAPPTVDALRSNQIGSMAMDLVWALSGFILWLPVLSPLPEGRAAPWPKMIYLVLATGMVAIIPASFLTFTSTPVYATYELAPRIGSLTALEDQQIAGIVMKIGTIPVTWTTMAVLWFRHAKQEASIP
jgi:putative membrane protein